MLFDEGSKILMEAVQSFRGNVKSMYGQIALRLDESTYLITGENMPFSSMIPEYISACDINTGDLGEIFKKRSDINAFIFASSQDIVEASKNGDSLIVSLDDMAHLTGANLKIVDNANPKTLLSALSEASVCLVKETGAIIACEDLWLAVGAAQITEKTCEAYLHGELIGGVKAIDEDAANSLKESFENKYLPTNSEESVEFVGFDEESFELRNEMTKACVTLAKENLIYGSWGNVSIKLNDETMLITPSSINNTDIKIEDLTRVNIDTLEKLDPREPSGNAALYARMFKELPGCNAIVHTHSNACSTFAACEAGFSINDEAMQQLIGDVKLIPYYPGNESMEISATIETLRNTHAAIMAHQGAIFYGPSLKVVTEIAIAVEKLAQKLLKFDTGLPEENEE